MKKRNVMILVMLLVVGFAAVSTTLIINGTIGIGANEDDFDVIFTSATIDGEDATATIDETKKKITFTSSKLTSVGEKAILDYKIKNNSTQYDADVTINCTNENSEYISVTNELAGEEITKDYKTTFTAQEEKRGMITAELIKSVTQESDSIEVTCTIVANATETEKNAYTLKFDSNGGEKVEDKIIFLNEEYGDLPMTKREGYIFLGWYTEDSVQVTPNTILKTEGDKIVYAGWSKNTSKPEVTSPIQQPEMPN